MFNNDFYRDTILIVVRDREGRLFSVINIIIYEMDEIRKRNYNKIIKNFFYGKNDCYRVYEFDKYTKEMREQVHKIDGVRIFLINIDDKSYKGLDIARQIRQTGDLISPIILLTMKDKKIFIDKLQNVLFLNIIKVDEELIKELTLSLKDAFNIATRHSVYTFSIFDEVYRVPYNDIYYIKKNARDDSVTIYTKDDSFLHYASVKNIEKILMDDIRFFKSHRSCIINLYNVTSYDRKDNIVEFKNGQKINYVAHTKKSKLAERLKNFNNDSIHV